MPVVKGVKEGIAGTTLSCPCNVGDKLQTILRRTGLFEKMDMTSRFAVCGEKMGECCSV